MPRLQRPALGTLVSPARLLAFSGLFLLLSGAGIYTVYHGVARQSLTFDERLLSWPLAGSLAVLLAVYFSADGLRLYFTLRALGYRVAPRGMVRLVFVNIFFSNITPLATGGGFAQIWYLRQMGVPVGVATAATTIRTALAVVLIFAATPVALLGISNTGLERLGARVDIYIALFIALYLGGFAVVLLRSRWLATPALAFIAILRRTGIISLPRARRWAHHLKRELSRFSRSFARYVRGHPAYVSLSVLCTAVFLLSLFSFPALLLWGLEYRVEYPTVVGLLVVTTFIMYFSPTPGASGIAEGVFGHFFATIVAPQHLLLVTVAWRALTIYLGMAIGLALLVGGMVRRTREATHE
ncbi:lysylphosphatidylglycerol synthase transmembrane domain-containing protein [Aquisalimonas lutea]|uniref:lysylphosphatidylglycerol synthase transmembrane domain-containing protein n=1 Tax=Aquisalimonas lutea TaxID=1327750 RepID=UPI0025B57F7F|nr:lysylphosphatidylglycerol synthase transmembrane domain-containing protein [Aquisalimonas lutea]MDN3519444.1 lysylphosphatidylglycerol synthase transmembrane domain-containing protein [Aquisalimonas lutea]